jgi:hypothetical protein
MKTPLPIHWLAKYTLYRQDTFQKYTKKYFEVDSKQQTARKRQ